ncbi:NRDC protein, partial [Pseudoatta argentina]
MSEGEHTTEGNKPDVEYVDSPDKSEYDKAEYRVIKLQNGLTALLISDLEGAYYDGMSYKNYGKDSSSAKRVEKDVWKAFCGLCVGVGSFGDPPELPGLAHFLQRVVFKGSKKYPKENDFNEFISLHGGTTNGATDCEHTRFYFDISEKHLFAALDRFVQFFIEPLMKKDVIRTEREIVQREFQWSLYCDKNKKEQILSLISRTGHPPSKFLRRTSLHNDVDDDKLYEELHKFRERHYSAHRMMLNIQARLPLDTLQTYVTICFGNILSNWLPSDDFTEFEEGVSFDTVAFKKMYEVKPIKDISQVNRGSTTIMYKYTFRLMFVMSEEELYEDLYNPSANKTSSKTKSPKYHLDIFLQDITEKSFIRNTLCDGKRKQGNGSINFQSVCCILLHKSNTSCLLKYLKKLSSTLLTIIANNMINFEELISEDLFKIIKMYQFKAYYNKFLKPEKFIEIRLKQFSEKELDDIKEGLRILKQPDNAEIMKNEVDRNWSEIIKQQFMFDRCEKEALAIENRNINKLTEWFESHTLNESSLKKLSVHVIGIDPKEIVNEENRRRDEYCLTEFIIDDSQHKIVNITDVKQYKYNRPIYPYINRDYSYHS